MKIFNWVIKVNLRFYNFDFYILHFALHLKMFTVQMGYLLFSTLVKIFSNLIMQLNVFCSILSVSNLNIE